MKKLRDDCFLHDKDRLKHDEALTLLEERLSAIVPAETVSLIEASGRILAEPISTPRNIPSTDNSAVDGYAFALADHEQAGGFFPISARVAAGQTEEIEIPTGSAARIFTGAPMPKGADSVAMQEDCETHEQDGTHFVVVPAGLKKGANCRKAGEDVSSGELVSEAGKLLRPQEIAAIASTGTSELSVFRKLRIGLLSSGNEVLRPGQSFKTGQVYDSNHFMLQSLLMSLPVEVTDLGVCPDDAGKVEQFLADTADSQDIIISTGGASRGEEDHFVNALDKLGSCHMWQLAVKPGRPMSFGQIGITPCFTLPGNPVAAFVCFLLYVRPSLIKLGGGDWITPQRYPIKAGFEIKSKPDRREFLRGYLETGEDGSTTARKFERDGSGLISGLRAATGLIEVPEITTQVALEDQIEFIPLSEFGIVT